MNKKLILGSLVIAGVGLTGYISLQKQSPLNITEKDSDRKEVVSVESDDLVIDLTQVEPIDTFSSPLYVVEQTGPVQEAPVALAEAAPIPEKETVLALHEEMKPFFSEPKKAITPKKQTPAAAPLQAAVQDTKNKILSKQEKIEKFTKNMEDIHKQAEEEWAQMSPEEREVAEAQIEEFQSNFQHEIERLSKLTPEEIEREKNEAMARLQIENPEAYQAVRSMEEVFVGLADASNEQ